jgi:hypothetical protein
MSQIVEAMESGSFLDEVGDYQALVREHAKDPPPIQGSLFDKVLTSLILGIPWVLAAAPGVGMAILTEGRGNAIFVGMFLGGLLGLLAFGVRDFLLQDQYKKVYAMKRKDRRNRWRVGPWRVRIDQEGMTHLSEGATHLHRWSVIWALTETREHAFFYVNTDTAITVPRRAFPDSKTFRDFVDLADRYIREERKRSKDPSAAPSSTDIIRDVDFRKPS